MTDAISTPILTISDSEWEVMRVLWADAPLTSREIIDRVLDILDWKEGTVKSLINRLVKKNNIKKVKTDTVFKYQPTISEYEANHLKVNKVFDSVCTKERANVISHLVEDNTLSQTQIEQLIKQLEVKAQTAPIEVNCECLAGQCHCHLH
ncbi:CopY/TcrY family copper transport repressor [Aerococcaceae bacterium DSM 111021]|nr:CopY/TcrY family copper transport repressor [Aerococcaceae bacterium DSM 111021]